MLIISFWHVWFCCHLGVLVFHRPGTPESQSLTNLQEGDPSQLTLKPCQENDDQTINQASEEERFSSERTGNKICFLKHLFFLGDLKSSRPVWKGLTWLILLPSGCTWMYFTRFTREPEPDKFTRRRSRPTDVRAISRKWLSNLKSGSRREKIFKWKNR